MKLSYDPNSKTTFKTHYECHEFLVFLFGLTMRLLYVFMDLINRMFQDYINKFMIVFIDDNLNILKTNEDHEKHLILILEIVRNKKLCAKFFKGEFWLKKYNFSIIL